MRLRKSAMGPILISIAATLTSQGAWAQSDPDCVPIDATNLSIEVEGIFLNLTDGISDALLRFLIVQLDEAQRAKEIIEFYGFTEQCFVGRPDASMVYWLVDGRSPVGNLPGDDCIPIVNPEVTFQDGQFKILSQNGSALLAFGFDFVEAQEALRIVNAFDFLQMCFVGRPNASMEYFLGSPDRDGDGLPDRWETFGFDADDNGIVDVDLPGFGADPDHKDIFLEFDWMTGQAPTRAAIQNLKQAFALAPVDAGGNVNPDGLPGIRLWVDTGNLTDPTAPEDGGPPNSCSDGIDNGPDGTTDANDPDCLVGDDLGGGNAVPASGIPNLDASFYASKAANFNTNRAPIFRYGLSAQPGGFGGGWGEIGGNDFIEYNHDPGTIMHELGHTLNLQHGGNIGDNCKPNYVSVMNYDNQFGIFQAGGGAIVDYSPPRFIAGRGLAPLDALEEDDLDEPSILDATDPTNQFVFVNALGNKVRSQLNQSVDWNGDGDTTDVGVAVNVDTVGMAGNPAACANGDANGRLTGHHDWDVIALNFRPFGDSADGALNPVTEPEPDVQDMMELREELNTTDLVLEKADSADPVEAGEGLVYTLTVTNRGPNPASEVVLVDTLPAGVGYEGSGASCSLSAGREVSCSLAELGAMESTVVEIRVRALAPGEVTNSAVVTNEMGPDSRPEDNAVEVTTQIVDTTPPTISAPPDLTLVADAGCSAMEDIGLATADDIADPMPVVTSDAPEAFELGETVVTWVATDASGNAASATQVITVVDLDPPAISHVSAEPDSLWPPNHKLVSTSVSVDVSDNCEASPTCSIVSIASDEPDAGRAKGDRSPDSEITGALTANLRAERLGGADGRTYTIHVQCVDGSGQASTKDGAVEVGHDQGR